MGQIKRIDFEESSGILEEEDDTTLAAIDRGIKAAEEGRVVPLDEVRRRVQQWNTKSSSPKTR